MNKSCTNKEDEELKEALGEYHKIYVEFIAEKNANEKAQVEQLKNKNRTLKKLNDNLKKQIKETKPPELQVNCN